jgi:uncharacterized protein (TIGR02266 family)
MGEAARKLSANVAAHGRTSTRAAVHVCVDLSSEHNFWSGLTMNMSDGGLFVATHNIVPVGTELVLNMVLPFESEPIVLLSEVRWTRPYSGQDDVPPGIGLRFVKPDASALAKIKRFVATVREPLFFDD